ncbi:MAG: translocation/assembly module TamB domain-containing protein, partial [Bacteroidota bacterium]
MAEVQQPGQEELPAPDSKQHPKKKSLRRFFFRLVLVVSIFTLLLFGLIQIPGVQTWTLRQVTNSLARQLNTTVRVDYLELGLFNRLILQDVYIEDLQGDTLLYSEGVFANLSLSPITLLRKGLVINRLRLNDSQLFIRRAPDQIETNLNLLLNNLADPEKPKKEKNGSISIDLDVIELGAMRMTKMDSLKNQLFILGMNGADIKVCDVDLEQQDFALKKVVIHSPEILVDDYIRTAMWDSIVANRVATTDSSRLRFSVDQFEIQGGTFKFHNYRKAPVKTTPDSILDYKHMEAYDIKMEIQNFRMERDTFYGAVQCFSFHDLSGFVLNDWSAEEVKVHSQGVEINTMRFQTDRSLLGDTLQLRYKSYEDYIYFPDRVEIDLKVKDSRVAMYDVMQFAPKLFKNRFFIKNREKHVLVNGRLIGTVNNLDGKNLNFRLEEDNSEVQFSFSSRNLAIPGANSMNLRLNDLDTDIATLKRWLPNFSVSSNFDRLGRLNFNGKVGIIFTDVITDGLLLTDIGEADLDIRLRNLRGGRTGTRYSGQLDLRSFDLGQWTGNPDFGIINLNSKVSNGVGLTAASASAVFSANVFNFSFKGYDYKNATITGSTKEKQFDGIFAIKDSNIDFGFVGKIDISGEVPVFNFGANVQRLNLKALNLSEKDYRMAGKIDLNLRNQTLSTLEGNIDLNDFIISNGDKEVGVEYLQVFSKRNPDSTKAIEIESDVIEAQLNGLFEIEQVPNLVGQFFQNQFPLFAHQINLNIKDSLLADQAFDYNIQIKDSKGLQRLFVEQMEDLKGISITGSINNQDTTFNGKIGVPNFGFGKALVKDLYLDFEVDGLEGDFNLAAGGVAPNDQSALAPLSLLSTFRKDTVYFGLTYDNRAETAVLNRAYFDGVLNAIDSNSTLLRMADSELILFDKPWVINDQNEVLFKEDSILIHDFTAIQDDRIASIGSFAKRGINLSVINLDFDGLNGLLNYKPLQFDGDFNLSAQTTDILNLTNIHLDLGADTLFINGDDWGNLKWIAQMDDAKQPVMSFLTLTKDTSQLILDAFYNVADVGKRPEELKGYFDADLGIQSFPLSFSEYFIGGTISNATGGFDGKLRFNGTGDQPNVHGTVTLKSGGVTLNYLKTRYSFQDEVIFVDNYAFDASDAKLYDIYGNPATIIGGIRHNRLRDFGFDARLTTDRFQGLNTQKGDNKLFYGHGIGKADVYFTGTFRQPDVYVKAEVAEGTKISIPINSDRSASEIGFVRLVDQKKLDEEAALKKENEQVDLKGVSLDMELIANNSAEIQIIFDEQAGDLIEGRGYGDLLISVPRDGDFKMYGDYTIETGDYLFTLYNIINKKFSVERGGTISWTGDPYTAEVDLVAEYSRVNTPVATFIQEYLIAARNDIVNQANNGTDVDLKLLLTGELLKPTINFDISFPSLQGELQTYTDSKLRLLKLDQNELNKQVFGLIVAGQFLPTEINLNQTGIIANTVGEFLSNQLSLLLTQLLSQVIGEGKVFSSTDFDIAYNQYQNNSFQNTQTINRGNELQVSLTQNFLNDRISVKVGGNVDLDGRSQAIAGTSSSFVGNDFIIEAFINEQRNVTLRVYQRTEPDIGGRLLEIG